MPAGPSGATSGSRVDLAGHLAGERVVRALAVRELGAEPERVGLAGALADGELRREAEHRVLDRRRRAVRPGERLEAHLRLPGDRGALARELDRPALHAEVLADQRHELAERAALL